MAKEVAPEPYRARATQARRRQIRRRRIGAAIILAGLSATVVAVLPTTTRDPSDTRRSVPPAGAASPSAGRILPWTPGLWLTSLENKVRGQPGHLQPGSDPAVLPGPILIADRNNSRLLLVDPEGRILWQFPPAGSPGADQTLVAPDDAFFSPDGHDILATQEENAKISEISLQSDRVVWSYGHPGVPGSLPGYLSNPDDAMLLPNGKIVGADIKNCRLLYLSEASPVPLHIYGETTTACRHQPPARFGSPNGMFPMANGDWLVTEINGDWVDEMTPSGQIAWSVHPPGITYPSDTNEVSPGVYLTAAYTNPGVIEEFDSAGRLLWRFAPTGASGLDKPSLALPLPSGDVLVNDDWNHRVIVVDPRSDRIVWQYGVTGVPGDAPGYLSKPDGVDLAPPYSLDASHSSTMGIPPFG